MEQCEKIGLGKGQVLSTGIPIDPAFEENLEKNTLRQRLGLQSGLATIMIMGGGLGMGPLLAAVRPWASWATAANSSLLQERIKPCLKN